MKGSSVTFLGFPLWELSVERGESVLVARDRGMTGDAGGPGWFEGL